MIRELLKVGREHDRSMTPAPWSTHHPGTGYAHICGWNQHHEAEGPFGGFSATGPDVWAKEDALHDAAGIAWMRSSLSTLLDAHEAALAEIERLETELNRTELELIALQARVGADEDRW